MSIFLIIDYQLYVKIKTCTYSELLKIKMTRINLNTKLDYQLYLKKKKTYTYNELLKINDKSKFE